MRARWDRLGVVLQVLVLAAGGLLLLGAIHGLGTNITAGPIQAVRVTDGLGNQLAAVDHFGAQVVAIDSSRLTADRLTISHVSSVTHVSGLISVRDDNCLTCRGRVDHYNAVAVQSHISGKIRAWQVSQCGATAAQAVVTDPDRRTLIVKNIGTTANVNIWVGFGTTGHVALTAGNGWALGQHEGSGGGAAAVLQLDNYQGPLACISTGAGMTLGVLEIMR